MNANDLTFGIEIETTIPRGTLAVGPHGCGCDIPQLPGWKADRDPSIRVRDVNHEACEFVSPVFKGAAGVAQLLADLATIRSMGARVNASCGLHIHVGFDKSNVAESAKLATVVSNFEKAFYASTGTKARERGRWCAGLSRYGSADRALTTARCCRYHVANFATRKPTVEFRAFAATLNTTKLIAHIRTCLGVVEKTLAIKRLPNWTAKTPSEKSPIRRAGEGQTALNRLFYWLGWTKGRVNEPFGIAGAEVGPSVLACKKQLVRLARKYDAQR